METVRNPQGQFTAYASYEGPQWISRVGGGRSPNAPFTHSAPPLCPRQVLVLTQVEYYEGLVDTPLFPAFVVFVSAGFVSYCFMQAYSMAISTLLLSFCLDEDKYKSGLYAKKLTMQVGTRASIPRYGHGKFRRGLSKRSFTWESICTRRDSKK
jgi:hypothetical protein